jgi:smad nuclear-interacting protein 1
MPPPASSESLAASRRRSRSREHRDRDRARKRTRSRSRSPERRSRPRRGPDDDPSGHHRRERSLERRRRDGERGRDADGERAGHRDRADDGRDKVSERERDKHSDRERLDKRPEKERRERYSEKEHRDRDAHGDRDGPRDGKPTAPADRDRRRDPERERDRGDRHSRRRHARSPERPSPAAKAPPLRLNGPLPSQADSFARQLDGPGDAAAPKERPNFGATGHLAREANTVAGRGGGPDVVLRYHEPADARAPPPGAAGDWRMYVFRGDEVRDERRLAERSCWLLGGEAAVADVPVEHPSASGQHAVVQFRAPRRAVEAVDGVAVAAAGGGRKDRVRPYLIDLESKNGTVLNGQRIEPRRFVEIRSGDVMRIGHSEREYVFVLPPREGA